MPAAWVDEVVEDPLSAAPAPAWELAALPALQRLIIWPRGRTTLLRRRTTPGTANTMHTEGIAATAATAAVGEVSTLMSPTTTTATTGPTTTVTTTATTITVTTDRMGVPA